MLPKQSVENPLWVLLQESLCPHRVSCHIRYKKRITDHLSLSPQTPDSPLAAHWPSFLDYGCYGETKEISYLDDAEPQLWCPLAC